MSTRKDTPSVSSLGRVQGQKLSREGNSSRDSIASHPLLSPPPAITTTVVPDNKASSAASTSLSDPSANTSPASSSPKYVPYTPRHRVSTSQVTAQSSPPTIGTTGGATPQLQLQNLKAAAQNAQLTSGSVGWAICEKLYQEGEGSEWEDIWTAVTTNRATLLLPLDQALPQENITSDYVRDHVIYCTGPSNKTIPVVTLSGLRGFISDNTLTIRSVIPTNSPQFQALASPTSRLSTLANLPPLPSPLIVPLKPEYPVFNIPAPHTELPFPSKPLHKPQSRPVLSTPRLNPFASLFGARASPATTPAPLPASTSGEEIEGKSHAVEVSIYVIQGRMLRKDIIKSISNSIKAEFREVLTGLPSWMVEWSIAFASSLHPQLPGEPKKPLPRQPSSSSKMPSIIEPDMTDHSTASESFQSFYGALEDELLEKEQQSDHLSEKKADGRLTYNPAQEDRRYQMVERVERAVCALFYDQLFRRKPSDDASHDEALSSRIAALNMLDLGLEHLGIDIGKAGNGLQAVVTSVGQALQRLQDPSCRAPVDKAAAMVAAHNVAVEGLSRLPPIRLKPDEEMLAEEPTPLASQFKQNVNVSGDGEKASLKSPLTTLPEDKPVELLSPTLDPTSPSVISGPDVSTLQSPTSEGDDTTKRTPVASDILLPFMIYSIVKTNPPELVSHLLYTQRYRMRSHSPSSGAGEEAFCLINLLAAVEFLENVDLAALGLADSSRVLSVADLAPLPLSPNALTETGGPDSPLASPAAKLRGRVNQQVEELAGSANKVLSGVVDSSFLALKGLLSNNNVPEKTEGSVHSPSSMVSPNEVPPWNLQRPGFGLLRRGTEFTLASVTSSLPALQRVTTGGSRRGGAEESGQMLKEVPSRPESIKVGYRSDEDDEGSDEEGSESDAQHSEGDDHGNASVGIGGAKSDVRSIRSFGSMMSGESRDRRSVLATAAGKTERLSLSDRLANVSVRSRLGKDTSSFQAQSPPSKRASLLGVSYTVPNGPSSRPTSPSFKIPGPNERFMECDSGDLKLSEVGELLIEYRRVVEGLRALGGFDEPE